MIAIDLLTSAAFGEVIYKAAGMLVKRASDAREIYSAKAATELNTDLEVSRRECLDELGELQTRIITSLSNQSLLQKTAAVVLELTAEAYEAKLEDNVASVRRRIGQLKSVLDRHDKDRAYRGTVRLVAVVVSLVAFVLLFLLAIVGPSFGLSTESFVPVLQIPVPVLLWSTLGSFTSLVYRFNTASDVELQDPLRWLVTRPLTGVVMGTIAFLAIKVGALAMEPELAKSLGKNELVWLAAFLAGFSDRFSETILKSIVGKLGGDKTADFFSPTTVTAGLDWSTFFQSVPSVRPGQANETPTGTPAESLPAKSRPENDSKTSDNNDIGHPSSPK